MAKNTKYKRNCPNCKRILYYSSKYNMEVRERKNSLCKYCIRKGKTYEEIYGPIKAKEIIQLRKGKTYQEIVGNKKANDWNTKKSENRKGKTWEDICGINDANEIRYKCGNGKRELTFEQQFGKIKADNIKEKMRESSAGEKNGWYGKHHSEEAKKKIKCANLGKKLTDDIKKKISVSMRGMKKSQKTKRNMRLSSIKRIEKNKLNGNQLVPNFNPNACQLIEEYGKRNGYNFQHTMNGGEYYIKSLGYWVDGYDKDKNVVIEYYEKHHNAIKEKDENRKNEILNFLDCKFIEIKE